jgi:cell division protein FtsI/penicillin-binding protein 2
VTKPWTSEEIAKLKSMAQKYPGVKIAEQLSRSYPATRVKAHKLGLSLRLENERRGAFMSGASSNLPRSPASRPR